MSPTDPPASGALLQAEPPETGLRPSTVLALLAILAGALLLRLSALPGGSGASWDTVGYVSAAHDLGGILGGSYPSVYGAQRPHIYPLGLPLVLALLGRGFEHTVTAGVLLSIASGLVACAAAFALGRTLHGQTAGLVAATWIALDPKIVEYDSVVTSEALFAALTTLGCLGLAGAAPLSRRRGCLAVLAFGAGWFVRAAGIAPFALGLVLAARRVEVSGRRAVAATGVVLAALVLGLGAHVARANGCAAYWRSNADLTLFDEGLYLDYYDVGSDGATQRGILDQQPFPGLLARHAGVFAKAAGAAAARPLRAAWLPVALALAGLLRLRLGRDRARLAAHAGVFLVAGALVLFPVATLIHRHYMLRMLMPALAPLDAVAAAGGVALAGDLLARLKLGHTPPGWRGAGWGILGALALAWATFDWTGLPPLALCAPGGPGTYWERSRAFAGRVRAVVPPRARIMRGPGGRQDLNALFERPCVLFPDTTPVRLEEFVRRNDLRFVLHGDDSRTQGLLRALFGTRSLEAVARLEGDAHHAPQAVSRLGP